MNVIAVTLFISLLLAVLFVVVFVLESKARASGRRGGMEHESLLPLDDGEAAEADPTTPGKPS